MANIGPILKKFLITLVVLALLAGGLFLAWKLFVDEPPDKCVLRAASAAMLGDEQGFLDGFTDDSRALVAPVLALSRGEDMAKSPRHPYYFLATENIVSVERDSAEFARVRVRRPGDDKSQGYDIPMSRGCVPKYLILERICLVPTWQIDAKRFTGGRLDNKADK